MYCVRKHPLCWELLNQRNGKSRLLRMQEVLRLVGSYPELSSEQVRLWFVSRLPQVRNKP